VRLQPGEGHEADAPGARGGPSGRVLGGQGEGRDRRVPTPRARPLGHHAAGRLRPPVVFRRRRAPVLSRRRDGRWSLNLEPDERTLLVSLAEPLQELLDDGPDDPSLDRLRPPAYPDDPEAEAGYRLLAGE